MKYRLYSLLHTFPLLLISILSLKLYAEGKLTLYVHPRYLTFVLVASVIALLLSGLFMALALSKKSDGDKGGSFASVMSMVVSVVLVVALLLPARSLSTELAEQRFVGAGRSKGECKPFDDRGFSRNEFLRWSEQLATCGDPLFYQGQTIKVEGFIYDVTSKSDSNAFAIGRFVVRCCAIDAQPLLLTVKQEDWTSLYQSNQWIRIEGEIQPIRVNGELIAGIVPTKVEIIPEPEEPYVFY